VCRSKIFSDRLGTPRCIKQTDNKGQDMNNPLYEIYVEYRGIVVDRMIFELEKDILDEHLDFILGKGNSYQPERSKREDLIDVLQQELIERHKLSIEICKAQLGCGALNPMET
jgi:hypothetical protein